MNKYTLQFVVLLSLISYTLTTHAGVRSYAVSIEQSDWTINKQSRLICELEHSIPGFGRASFVTEASKQLNLTFNLDMLRLPALYGSAQVYSVPPKWMRGAQQKRLGNMDLRKQYDADLPEDIAWNMLTELEKGFWPTIYYKDWANSSDHVSVALNASNFADEYNAFNFCVSNLLPFSFDDIAYTVLSYEADSSELTDYSQKRLDMIGEYLKEDIELDLVLIDSYTDSYGADWLNEQLSVRRAEEVKNYFASMGVDQSRIEITGHGEERHASSNNNDADRLKNRRVVIRMSKSSRS